MDAIQLLTTEVAQAVSGNTIYEGYKSQWRYMMESYLGGMEYQNAQHLVKYQLETEGEYQNRLDTTPLQNHCSSVISVYNSFLFGQQPQRSFGSVKNMPELEDFLNDADFDGRSLNSFMKDAATWASVFGHAWVVVAKPDIGATTRADELAQGVRPYLSLLTPLVVLDWRYARAPSGRYHLEYIRYVEDVNGDVSVVKEWTMETVRTMTINTTDDMLISDEQVPNQLGTVPLVCVYNKRSTIRGIGISDIGDIADAQKFIYNATSEIDQSIRLDSHPSLVKTLETNAGIGAGSLIHMPENLDPGLKPYILEFSGASIDKILSAIEHTIESIDKMANTGAIRAVESRTMSGVAMQTEFSLLNARLAEKGSALELAEEQIWILWSRYMGKVWNGVINYPDSFNIRDNHNDLDLYLKASTANINSKTFNKVLQKEIAKLIVEDESEMQAVVDEIEAQPNGVENMMMETHDMMNPETGDVRTVSTMEQHELLESQGWVEAV